MMMTSAVVVLDVGEAVAAAAADVPAAAAVAEVLNAAAAPGPDDPDDGRDDGSLADLRCAAKKKK